MRFADLYVRPGSTEEAVEIFKRARWLGIGILGFSRSNGVDAREVEVIARKAGLRVVYRYNIEGERRSEVAGEIRRAPGGHIIAVIPHSMDVARYAAVNKRVHIITVPPGMERIVDRSTAKLFRDRGWGSIEIVLDNIIDSRGNVRLWRHYYISMRRAFAYKINTILSSGASSYREMWHPYQMAGIAALTGVPGEYALTWVSSVPSYIVSLLSPR